MQTNEIIQVNTIDQYNKLFGIETRHPLIGIVDLNRPEQLIPYKMNIGFYALFLKEEVCGELTYGRGRYDYQEGTVVALAPGQIVGLNNPSGVKPPASKGLLFHPDLIRGTALGQEIRKRGQRGPASVAGGTSDRRRLSEQDRNGTGTSDRQAQPPPDYGPYRRAARLLFAFLRPPVHDPQRAEPRRHRTVRATAGRIFRKLDAAKRGTAFGPILRGKGIPLSELFRRHGTQANRENGLGVHTDEDNRTGQGKSALLGQNDEPDRTRTRIPVPAAPEPDVQAHRRMYAQRIPDPELNPNTQRNNPPGNAAMRYRMNPDRTVVPVLPAAGIAMTNKSTDSKIRIAREPASGEIVPFIRLRGWYTVVLRDSMPESETAYGRKLYDFAEGTLTFGSPETSPATIHMKTDAPIRRFLAFRPDLLCPAYRRQAMKDYSFFAYDQSEALHLSHREKQTIVRCMDDLGEETGHSADTHSDSLLSGLLECLLDYCMRYYERQFITRGPANEQLMRQYESVLDGYIRAGKLRTRGFPTAEYCSQRLGLSSAYFSDMVEHETGKRPETYVELKRMQIARQRLLTTKTPVRAIAEELGFPSSQFFCSLFKKITGLTPDRYRTFC